MDTKAEYRQYVRAVDDFFKKEGIRHLSSGHHVCPECGADWGDNDTCPNGHGHRDLWNEPHFSSRRCDCCGTGMGGDREHATAFHEESKEVNQYVVCQDCVYFAEYGLLDDTTMWAVEKDQPRCVVKGQGSGKCLDFVNNSQASVLLSSGDLVTVPWDDVILADEAATWLNNAIDDLIPSIPGDDGLVRACTITVRRHSGALRQDIDCAPWLVYCDWLEEHGQDTSLLRLVIGMVGTVQAQAA